MSMYRPYMSTSQESLDDSQWGPGGCYFPTPLCLRKKKGVLNIQSTDNHCFAWCVLAHRYPAQLNRTQVSHYQPYLRNGAYDFSMISFPTPLEDLPAWEKANNTAISVVGFDAGESVHDGFSAVYHSHLEDPADRIDILLIRGDSGRQHFCLITDFSALMSHRTKHHGKTYHCPKCLHFFSSEDLLRVHDGDCVYGLQRTALPDKDDNILKFRDTRKQLMSPFIVVMDTEAFNVNLPSSSAQGAATVDLTRHEINSYGYQLVSSDPSKHGPYRSYRGVDAASHFLESLRTDVKPHVQGILKYPVPMKPLTPGQMRQFTTAAKCHLCEQPFLANQVKVNNHCHLTGSWVGIAHQSCNLAWKYERSRATDEVIIQVFAHNLKCYDAAHILSKIAAFTDEVKAIAENFEKFISFDFYCFRFLDSFSFMPSSLERLVENLAKDDPAYSKFHFVKSQFPADKLHLLIRKSSYPYRFVDGPDKFDIPHLPAKEDFFNDITQSHISDHEYSIALEVWNAMGCQTFADYHDLYLKLDVLLLCDCLQDFRDNCMEGYGLDPVHYYTAPGMAFSALLKMSRVELELITDIDIYIFLERCRRGGITQLGHKVANANNPDVPSYDPSKPMSWVLYIDVNSLYGCPMLTALPYGGFKFVDQADVKKMTKKSILDMDDEGHEGMFFEVDLIYPKDLHDLHADLPFCAENITVTEDMLSPHMKEVWKLCNGDRPYKGMKKLLLTLDNKTKYVCHFRVLKQCLNHGLEVSKIHRALRFQQKPWMRDFVMYNARMRQTATSESKRQFHKGQICSSFGKTIENVRNRRDIRLVSSREKFLKLSRQARFVQVKRFPNNLLAVEIKKTVIKLDRPIFVGVSILDISKVVMYRMYYDHLRPKYGDNVKLNYMDTDSYILNIFSNDPYTDMKTDGHLYDLSSLPTDHRAYDPTGKKILGRFSDEMAGRPIQQFVGLRPKLYSVKAVDMDIRRAKGVNKATTEKELRHETYLNCLESCTVEKHDMVRIRQKNMQLFTTRFTKISMSPLDDKRYWVNSLDSIPYGHYLILSEREADENDKDKDCNIC